MLKPASTLLAIALFVCCAGDHVGANPLPSSDDTDVSDGIPIVTLTSQISFSSDLQCHKELTCQVEADTSMRRRLMDISILEKTSQTELKKVSSIYYAASQNQAPDQNDEMEDLKDVLMENGALVVRKTLPPNTGFGSEEFACKVAYLDASSGIKYVESHVFEEKGSDSCTVPNVSGKLNAVEDKLDQLLNLSTQDKVCKVPGVETKLAELENKLNKLSDIENKLNELISKVSGSKPDGTDAPPVTDSCDELRGENINPARQVVTWSDGTKVLCDTQTSGGGWTVFQRRIDGSVDFHRGWDDYENGFGDPEGELWLGLKHLQHLVETGDFELRIDLEYDGSSYHADFSEFTLTDPNYTLLVSGHSGTAVDSFSFHDGNAFSTIDRDNDNNPLHCAESSTGGWWYGFGCFKASLNGQWASTERAKGLNWYGITGYTRSFTFTEMKVRKKQSGSK